MGRWNGDSQGLSALSAALLFIKLGEQCGLILGFGYRHEHELESVASGVSDHDGVKRVVETKQRTSPHRILVGIRVKWQELPMAHDRALQRVPYVDVSALRDTDNSRTAFCEVAREHRARNMSDADLFHRRFTSSDFP